MRKPSFPITNPRSQQGRALPVLRWATNLPAGFGALLWTGGHPSKDVVSLLEQIRDIDGDFELKLIIHLPP